MSSTFPCTCTPSELTTVRFAHDVVLLRCTRHEQQAWTVAGRPATSARAHEILRAVFVESRPRRGERRTPARRHAAQRVAQRVAPSAPATTSQAITALLHARGLTGAWALA